MIKSMVVSSTTKKIASNTIYQIIGKFLSMSITVLATVIITRFYGKEAYGEFSLMQAWPALFFVIVDFGLNAIATRELSKDFSLAAKYIGNIFVIRILFSLVLMVLLFLSMKFFPYSKSLQFGIGLSLFLIITQALYTTTNIVFQVKLRYDLSTLGYILGYIFILVSILILSFYKAPIFLISFMYVVGGFFTFLINYMFLLRLNVRPIFTLDTKLLKFLFFSSLPLGFMFVFSQINFKSDSILLSVLDLPLKYNLNNTESVVVYSLPYKIFEVALVIPTFFMNSVYPVLVRHMTDGKARLKNTFFRSVGFLALSAVLCSILGIIFSSFAINLLGGSQFSESVLVLQILMAGLIFYYTTQPISWLIVTLGKQKYLPIIYFISAVFNVVANIIFIPKYSFYASAVVTNLSELLILILLVYFAVRSWKEKYA